MVGTYLVKDWMRCIGCSCVCKWAVSWCAKTVCKVGNAQVNILGTYVLHEWQWERQWQVCSWVGLQEQKDSDPDMTKFWTLATGFTVQFTSQPAMKTNPPPPPPPLPPHDCNNSECPNRHFVPSLSEQVANTWLVQKTTAHLIVRAPCHQKCTPLLQQFKTACMSCDSVTSSALSDLAEQLHLYSPCQDSLAVTKTYTACVSYFMVTHSDPLHKLCLSWCML